MFYLKYFRLLTLIILLAACQNQEALSQNTTAKPKESVKEVSGSDKLTLSEPTQNYKSQFLDGSSFDSSHYKGLKLIFAYFNINNPASEKMLKNLETIRSYENQYHFRIFLVSSNVNQNEKVAQYLKDKGFTFPALMEDKNISLATKLKVSNDVSLMGTNNKHEVTFGITKYAFGDTPEGKNEFLNYIQENLAIPLTGGLEPYMGLYAKAIDFDFETLDGEKLSLKKLEGNVVFLMFFSPTCPHCQHEIEFINKLNTEEFRKAGFKLLLVSVNDLSDSKYKNSFENLKIKNALVVNDPDRLIKSLYTQDVTIPDVYYINRKGEIVYHDTGYGANHNNLIQMRLKNLLGLPNPPLLSSTKFNGVETCMVCHQDEYIDWAVTPHAHAFETLKIKGEEVNPDCIGCHTLGFNDSKGFKETQLKNGKTAALTPEPYQNVQCEHCHGIGGAHVSNPHTPEEQKQNCLECHTEKFSLHFDFEERVTKVNHSQKEKIMALSKEERFKLLSKVSKNPHDLFGSQVKYVGSESCLSCHATTHENWKNSAHGKAFETLKTPLEMADPNCLKCHTTGFTTASMPLNPAFKGVGCESCHGPGEVHVLSKKKEDIRGLGDDCPFCVVEQICLSCHDAKNDPQFNIHEALKKVKTQH